MGSRLWENQNLKIMGMSIMGNTDFLKIYGNVDYGKFALFEILWECSYGEKKIMGSKNHFFYGKWRFP